MTVFNLVCVGVFQGFPGREVASLRNTLAPWLCRGASRMRAALVECVSRLMVWGCELFEMLWAALIVTMVSHAVFTALVQRGARMLQRVTDG